MQDDLPQLDDFGPQLQTVGLSKRKQMQSTDDYTKINVEHVEDHSQQQRLLQTKQEHVAKLEQQIQQSKHKLEQSKHKLQQKQDYAGLKKGFFTEKSTSTYSKEKIPEIKASKNDPLRIPEVQQAMKMNNYLQSTKQEWLTDKFLTGVESNHKIQKLFSNKEYLHAIELFKSNPKEAMAKYANNKEVMEGFQEFCMLMGTQFQSLAAQKK